jgi:membrane associated rhomboid family serine protease
MAASSLRGAPITKCLCYTVMLGTFFSQLWPKLFDRLSLDAAPAVLRRGELWRLATSSLLLCDNFVAAGVSAYLLYHLRMFERQMGSSKFGAFLTLASLADAGARAAFLLVPGAGAQGVASGPFHVIFGLLPLYFRALFYWTLDGARDLFDAGCRGSHLLPSAPSITPLVPRQALCP